MQYTDLFNGVCCCYINIEIITNRLSARKNFPVRKNRKYIDAHTGRAPLITKSLPWVKRRARQYAIIAPENLVCQIIIDKD